MDTRMSIIEAAGELFAERGYAGTSIRAIVKKAKVFLSAVNYHFGSKEQLLLETLKYITTHRVMAGLMPILQDEKAIRNEEDFHQFLYQVVHGFLKTFLLSEDPAWCGRFFIRMSFELSPELRQKVFIEAGYREQFVRLAKHTHPSHSDAQVRLNTQACIGMLHHFVLTWNETRDYFGKGSDIERIERAARFLYARMVAMGDVCFENQEGNACLTKKDEK